MKHVYLSCHVLKRFWSKSWVDLLFLGLEIFETANADEQKAEQMLCEHKEHTSTTRMVASFDRKKRPDPYLHTPTSVTSGLTSDYCFLPFFLGRTIGALLAANMHRSSLSAHPCGVDHLPWPSILAHKNRWGQKHQNMFHPSILPLSPQYIHHVVQLPLNWHTLGSKTWWGWQRNHTICTSMIRTERWAVFKLGIDYSNKLTMTKEDQVLLIVTVHKTC